MVAKQLQYLAGADSAGIVLGARVPIVLTSRARHRAHAARLGGGDGAGRARQAAPAAMEWPMTDAIVVLNAGSSSLKFSLFVERAGELQR